MKKIEILAPAGSYEGMVAAINASCDAVYIGGTQFGARAYASNLTQEDLLRAIDYTHVRGKQLYLTVNTLLKEEELTSSLYQYLEKLYLQGLDAVIVQDVGALHFIHRNFPDLPIHASTQMTLTMAGGANLLKQYGVTRMVTSREMSLEEIRLLRSQTDLEIESFVHGALCYCYSGQCLMSSMIGGRSGNRGRCAQPCRMPYELYQDGRKKSSANESFLLSPKDICTVEIIPDLVEAGIDSFKIEGRMKRPEYTALVAHTYREYVDLYQKLGKEAYNEYISKNKKKIDRDMKNLMDLYNRGGFTTGYYKTYHGTSMMTKNRPNHSGVCVGKITCIKKNIAVIHLKEDIYAQDVLEFRGEKGTSYEFTRKDDAKKGEKIDANFKPGTKVIVGDLVYRTKNQKLLEEIASLYLSGNDKMFIKGKLIAKCNQFLTLNLEYKEFQITYEGDLVEPAKNQPITLDKIKTQLNKTNSSDFEFKELEIDMDDNIFIPVGKLNEIRRNALDQLYETIASSFKRSKEALESETNNKKEQVRSNTYTERPQFAVQVISKEQLKSVLPFKEVKRIYIRLDSLGFGEAINPPNKPNFNSLIDIVEEVSDHNKELCLVFPAVFRADTYRTFEESFLPVFDKIKDKVNAFLLKSLEEFEFVNRYINKERIYEIILDYNLYTMNREASQFWHELGVLRNTASLEATYQELKKLNLEESDFIVYGHTPLMVSTQCIVDNTSGCCSKMGCYELKDRFQKSFYMMNYCNYCYNIIYNGQPLSLHNQVSEIQNLNPMYLRLDFTFENPSMIETILSAYIEAFSNGGNVDFPIEDYTKGHFFRGVE